MNTPRNDTVNISCYLKEMAARMPCKRAVVYPAGRDARGRITYAHYTFEQLDRESDNIAWGLTKEGITRGVRTILMVKPSLDFFALTFALFKVGAVPVVVDPGMGIRRMLACLKEGRPKAFIGISKAHVLRKLYPRYFRDVKIWVTVGRRWFWNGPTLVQLARPRKKAFPAAQTRRDETAAILFTTGSTGPAKGAVYTHGNFDAQVQQIQSHFKITPDEIDLPTFPLFALFDPALGMTAVIPDMDPTKPAYVNPQKIIEAIRNQGVTNMFASPALLNRVGRYGKAARIKLPSLKRVVSAGAPVSPANIEQFSAMLADEAQIHTPYGATEAVPILSLGSREILSETRELSEKGFGMCVGRPINQIAVRLIRISDEPITQWSDDLRVEKGETGEIVVKGDLVTRHYFENPKADALSKIRQGDSFWHRMGDLAWQDRKDRFWFCGRKAHRVTTPAGPLFTIPCEAIFNNHPAVFRSALVGIGPQNSQMPIVCIERVKDRSAGASKDRIERELLELARTSTVTRDIKTILFHPSFPVDIRHNSKIFREKLAVWAQGQLKDREE